MIFTSRPFNVAGIRYFSTVALGSILAIATAGAGAAGDPHQEQMNARIQAMHDKLKITSAEEPLWNKMVQVMREDAKTMDALIQARLDRSKSMNAVEDLESYSRITQARADGARKLIPVFSALYASMSPEQKKEADTMFRNSDKQHAVQARQPKQ